jgi:hypothetical protein
MAALKMQKRFRALLQAARDRIRRKRQELAELQRKQKEMVASSQALSDMDRARMYRLQQELRNQTDYVINRMLLRPNTRFIVWWKAAFVFAVIFEIGGKVMEPRMKKRYKSYNKMVEQHVCPDRWSELAICHPEPPKPKFHERLLGSIVHLVNPNSTRFDPKPLGPPPVLPWYCSPTATSAQGAVVTAMEFSIRYFDSFMAVVFFLDVFISFFTGEFNEDTGILQPPGFFPRYILPGVLLQCIVNPQMETTAKIIKWCMSEFVLLGPVRVTRWTVALVVPLVLMIHQAFQNLRRRVANKRKSPMLA